MVELPGKTDSGDLAITPGDSDFVQGQVFAQSVHTWLFGVAVLLAAKLFLDPATTQRPQNA